VFVLKITLSTLFQVLEGALKRLLQVSTCAFAKAFSA